MATGAEFANVYDPQHNIIVAVSLKSPTFALQDAGKSGDPLPKLKNWSDVTYLVWKNICDKHGKSVSDISILVYFMVVNKDAAQILSQIIPQFSMLPESPPGASFEPDSDNFKAIMGTPPGQGIGWFLAQHQQELKGKTVQRIEITQTGKKPNIIWHLG